MGGWEEEIPHDEELPQGIIMKDKVHMHIVKRGGKMTSRCYIYQC